jgi:hypothetical protein
VNEIQRSAFDQELAGARHLLAQGCYADALSHLERAHVLGQERVVPHTLTHWLMLRIAVYRREPFAVLGQAVRIVLGALGSAIGIVPTGNTGGTDISMFKRLPIAPDLASLMEGRERS